MNFLHKIFIFRHELFTYIKNNMVEIFSHAFNRWYHIFIVFFNLLIWLFCLYIHINMVETNIALHYNVDFGIDLMGDINSIYIIPGLGLFILLFNLVIATFLNKYQDKKIFLHILFSSSLMSNVILLGGITSVYIINFQY